MALEQRHYEKLKDVLARVDEIVDRYGRRRAQAKRCRVDLRDLRGKREDEPAVVVAGGTRDDALGVQSEHARAADRVRRLVQHGAADLDAFFGAHLFPAR